MPDVGPLGPRQQTQEGSEFRVDEFHPIVLEFVMI